MNKPTRCQPLPTANGDKRDTPLASIDEREAHLLAAYAMHSSDTRGRKHAEAEHPYRGPYQRDRDRILHSAAFRRLSGKMQVFTGDMGDYHRTRLTHTMEVASIARTIGRALRLNEDLIEALALLHDLGHPPFGHAGEEMLNACLADEGGFSHNQFALVLVEELEQRYASFPGLNLTWEVLQAQTSRQNKRAHQATLLETQVVDLADSMAYNAHDVDDALKLQLVSLPELRQVPLVREATEHPRLRPQPEHNSLDRKRIVHELIDRQVGDVLEHTLPQIKRCESSGSWRLDQIDHGPQMAHMKQELASFLFDRVYRNPHIVALRKVAQDRLRTMFDGYTSCPERLPAKFLCRADHVGVQRASAEFLATMTDRYCATKYEQHFAD